ncbi:MAG: AraC family transcriptional regulator [Gammaproteobacteria bacterium]|nr:AraC family transcriptional regulator [Gammaproteobacteria bacterium]MDH3428393.1 AraC family transcriptional regulator [Gammaproteobacteria bacterium]
MDTISPVYARLLLRELERREIDVAPLFAGTSLSQTELLRGGDISLEDFLHILHTGDRLLGDDQLGLLLGRSMHVFAMGPVGAGLAMAPSLREGLQLLESFSRLHATYIDISSRSTTRGLTVTILYGHDTGHVERFHTETAMMLLQQYMETLAGEPVVDARYRLAIPQPGNTEIFTQAFHGHISFDAGDNEVDIPLRLLDRYSPYYHAELWRQAQMSLAQSLKEQSVGAGKSYTQHIAALLRSSQPPLPELGEVAFALHISQRTLNRRLQAEDTSFRQLKSLALVSRARLYLRDTNYSVESIAEELGYKDAANFRRAFRKCEGCSPIEYRRSRFGATSSS